MTYQELLDATGAGQVLVDFYADWCAPCRAMTPIVEKIGEENDIPVLKVNIDESPEIVEELAIGSIPLIVLFEDGEVIAESLGAKPAKMLRRDLAFENA